MEKRAGFKLSAKDVFLNIAGGLKVNDPGIDLAVVSSILSSNLDMALPSDICLAGEVGLSGEIRPVTRITQRIGEGAKLGLKPLSFLSIPKEVDFLHQAEIEGKTRVSKIGRGFQVLLGEARNSFN